MIGNHADDQPLLAVHGEHLADDVRRAAESLLGEAVRDDKYFRPARPVVVVR